MNQAQPTLHISFSALPLFKTLQPLSIQPYTSAPNFKLIERSI
jgi:hypothetical protein